MFYKLILVVTAIADLISELWSIFKDAFKQLNQKSIHCTTTHGIAVALFVVFFITVLWSIYPQ